MKFPAFNFLGRHRVLLTKACFIVAFLWLQRTPKTLFKQNSLAPLFDLFCGVLTVIGVFGRLWASFYISGYKNERLITDGPYSIVRHPLYLFSLLGMLGIIFASENMVCIAVSVIFFGTYYPAVMSHEEKILSRRHTSDYANYAARTPRFIPKFSLLKTPATYTVDTRKFRRASLDSMWFLWIFAIVECIKNFHRS